MFSCPCLVNWRIFSADQSLYFVLFDSAIGVPLLLDGSAFLGRPQQELRQFIRGLRKSIILMDPFAKGGGWCSKTYILFFYCTSNMHPYILFKPHLEVQIILLKHRGQRGCGAARMRGRGRSGGGGIRRNPSLLSDAGDLPASLPSRSSRRRAAQLPLESLGASAPLALLSPVFQVGTTPGRRCHASFTATPLTLS